MTRCPLWPRAVPLFALLLLLPSAGNPSWFFCPEVDSGKGAGAPYRVLSVQQVLNDKLNQEMGLGNAIAGIVAGGELVLAPDLVRLFYAARDNRPGWIRKNDVSPQVRILLQALNKSEADGLNPRNYHGQRIEAQLKDIEKGFKKKRPVESEGLADFDLLCSDAFLTCAAHLAHGKVNPETHAVAWQGACLDESLARLLEDALARNRVAEALETLPPRHMFYRNLKKALEPFRQLARKADWPPLPEKLTLKKGETGKEVKELGKRLFVLGDFDRRRGLPGWYFDDRLEAAVRRFQARHGLEVSGALDPPTLAAINVPLEKRCRQVEANLERWRWLPRDLRDRFIYVNIADFRLGAIENGWNDLNMKVVVGSEAWQTPDFASRMTHLIVNPDWTIPIPVILKETVNYVRQDPCYFRNNNMVILRKEGAIFVEVDPASIDWGGLTEDSIDFLIRQKPGPDNILGRLKFVFPNAYEVFLHDTPYQEDFAKTARAYSHGCIRAEKPLELAVWVLRGKPGWDIKQVLAAIETGEERTVKLAEPLDVYFLYNTAWTEDNGTIQFRPDIYERDEKLAQALQAEPPH